MGVREAAPLLDALVVRAQRDLYIEREYHPLEAMLADGNGGEGERALALLARARRHIDRLLPRDFTDTRVTELLKDLDGIRARVEEIASLPPQSAGRPTKAAQQHLLRGTVDILQRCGIPAFGKRGGDIANEMLAAAFGEQERLLDPKRKLQQMRHGRPNPGAKTGA